MLDFSKLRPEAGGFRGAFEGLICQLGRRHPPPDALHFVTIDGSGGDGGLEAYWVCKNGIELGYQAKFHLKSSDVDWSKIDGSVSAALNSHPGMTKMVIAIACDLTDTVPNRRGKSGRQQWKDHKAKWESSLNDRVVEFELWDAATIENLLVDHHSHGLRDYWFNEIELAATWFHSTFQQIEASLEERYNPDDHVEVSTGLLFGGLLRDERLKSEIDRRITDIAAAMPKHRDGVHEDVEAAFNRLSGAVQDLVSFRPTAFENPTESFPVERYRELSADIDETLAELSKAIDQHKPSRKPDERRKAIDQSYEVLASAAWQVRDACDEFEAFLGSNYFRADRNRFALLVGRAGAGKSHLIASQIDQMAVRGMPAVMLLGSHFTDARTLCEQIPGILGLSCDLKTFLGVLNAAGEARRVRALIAIDAINEGGGKRWHGELAGLIQSLHTYPWISLAASCRTEYRPYLISAAVSQEAAMIEVVGFVTAEEQERAAGVYLDKRGILRPATPWLSPEFNNPLFLRTTAIALEREGNHEYPKGLHGTKTVLSFFLKVVGRNLATTYDGSDELTPPLAAAVKALAEQMARRRQDYLALPEAQALIDHAFTGFSKTDRTWLDHLRLGGILRLDPFPRGDAADPLDMPAHVVRFAFQRFQDHLIAESLLNGATPNREGFQDDGPFEFLLRRYGPNGHSAIAHEWVGVFEALWIGHAERNRRELVDDLPGDAGTVRNSVRWAMMMKRRESSHGYRERT
ncbi:hypothetical protein GOC33_32105, partial [Sinorhizobium meliloti]|nr:hypothetical protein [Sinorhizobium meliloti]